MKKPARQKDLFAHYSEAAAEQEAPLAARMRPRSFDEFVGQEHIIGEGHVLRKSIEADQLPSIIFWGPPGSGKTTLANVIASVTRSHFNPISAVAAGVADLRKAVDEAKERRALHQQRTILFIDEIHRFNKAQQDAILPFVENGTITLIGATTENPSFEVISPLLSRCRVFTLEALGEEGIREIVRRALHDEERGLGKMNAALEEDALEPLIVMSNGDARVVLNALELAVSTTPPSRDGKRRVTLPDIEDARLPAMRIIPPANTESLDDCLYLLIVPNVTREDSRLRSLRPIAVVREFRDGTWQPGFGRIDLVPDDPTDLTPMPKGLNTPVLME
jgi:putative ATPase